MEKVLLLLLFKIKVLILLLINYFIITIIIFNVLNAINMDP